jgi:thioredoxin reductase
VRADINSEGQTAQSIQGLRDRLVGGTGRYFSVRKKFVSGATEVAIVGAGPYGLSIAAHLHARGTAFRIFGAPMRNWREGMPAGMHLKSDGFASDLYDPEGRFTLERFCAERGVAYHPLAVPVSLATFVAYGLAFQAECVPTLEDQLVAAITRAGNGFRLTLADGATVDARRVVVASGISRLEYVPAPLDRLEQHLCSHSSEHHELGRFAGRKVVVIGGGASATDLAALLHAAGASVELISRHPVKFHLPPGRSPRPLWQRIRRPHWGLGPSLRSTLCTAFPGVFRLLPTRLRLRIVRRHLGPSGGWFIRDLLTGAVPVHEGFSLQEAHADGDGAMLRFHRADGATLQRWVDHAIAATGYRVSLTRLAFLDQRLRDQITVADQYPVLSRNFESSVPGLYFAGVLAAGSFGPLMRFALGAGYTSRRLGAHLSRAGALRRSEPAVQAVTP